MKRFIIIFCISLTAVNSYAQKRKPQNQPYADLKRYHLGFHVGLHTQDMVLTNNGIPAPNGNIWYGEIPSYSMGFCVGIIGNLYINQYLNLRFTPTVYFGDKNFTFIEEKTKETFTTSLRSNYLMFPFDLKYTAIRLNNYRPYMIGGVYNAFDMGRKKGVPLLSKGMDYGVSIGLGCDIYLPFFKLCPELKFYFGLADVLEKKRGDLLREEDRVYSNALSNGKSRMIVLTFNFE
ncbi:MAG: PorT family protein [Tannerella sp.]|nr:PorT family protein [Tannerella sp.]